ncbi:MAG: hypothetical protein MHM6MM_001661 [Cercozoa sp. M6MM]
MAASAEQDAVLMQAALRVAHAALPRGEVPVGAVFARTSDGVIVAEAHNETNATCNATRHAEIVAIDELLKSRDSLAGLTLCVTVEPCIMCGYTLRLLGIDRVVFGCSNPRFGGNGSVLALHERDTRPHESTDDATEPRDQEACGLDGCQGYPITAGVRADEAIALLKDFYATGNPNAPESKRRRRLSDADVSTVPAPDIVECCD